MKDLLFKSSLAAPLLVGMAVLGFGSTQGDFQLPGREVNSIEASTIKGAACGGYASNACTMCTGNMAALTAGGKNNSADGGGCASNCMANAANTASCGS